MSLANKIHNPWPDGVWVDGLPLPTIVPVEQLTPIVELPFLTCYGGLDTSGRLQIHNRFDDPIRDRKRILGAFNKTIKVLKEDFGLYNVFTAARDERDVRFNKLFGWEEAMVGYLMSNGETWRIMVRYF